MIITSSKCRPRNSAGRFWITVSPYQIGSCAFATDPYDEQIYLQSLRRRGSLLSAAVGLATGSGWTNVAGFQKFSGNDA
jgi:hypothetical protein